MKQFFIPHNVQFMILKNTGLLLLVTSSFVLSSLKLHATNTHKPQNYAVLIGISYTNDKGEMISKNSPPLKGTINSTLLMKHTLINHFGFKPQNIMLILNKQATYQNILDSLSLVKASLRKGDKLFFYYCGHGSQLKNIGSKELDKMDETICPYDSVNGSSDLRDKELATVLNTFLSKGIKVVAMLDCCHSGSGTRGINREEIMQIAPSDRVINDPKEVEAPEKNGALVFSAAQDYETAKGTPDPVSQNWYANLTKCFVDAALASDKNIDAMDLFLKTKAIMSAKASNQEPVIAGIDAVKYAPLFGSDVVENLPQQYYVMKNNVALHSVVLQGGEVDGLEKNDILINEAAEEKLKITKLIGINQCEATVIKGDAAKIEIGKAFTILKKGISTLNALKIYFPPQPQNKIAEALNALEFLKKKKSLATTPDEHSMLIYFNQNNWMKKNRQGDEAVIGENLDENSLNKLANNSNNYFINVPLPDSIFQNLKNEYQEKLSTRYLVSDSSNYNYMLCSTFEDGTYKICLKNNFQPLNKNELLSPEKTDWINVDNVVGESFCFQVKQLAKIYNWMNLKPTSTTNNFPFHLKIFNSLGSELKNKMLFEGEEYHLKLVLDSTLLSTWDKKSRWIYVFYVDHHTGEIDILFPDSHSNVENHLPYSDKISKQIFLRPIKIDPPFGSVSIYYLFSETPIPNPDIIKSKAINTRGIGGGELENLLLDCTFSTRSIPSEANENWGLEKMIKFTTAAIK